MSRGPDWMAVTVGGLADHHRMTGSQVRRGIGGAVVGIGVGLLGAARSTRRIAPRGSFAQR